MDVVTPEQARLAEDAGAAGGDGARARAGRHPPGGWGRAGQRSRHDPGHPAGGLDPGDGEVSHRPLHGGADPGGPGGRLHRRERGADPGRRGVPHRQAGLPGALRVWLPGPGRGPAPDRRRARRSCGPRGRPAPATSSRRSATCAPCGPAIRRLGTLGAEELVQEARTLGAPVELVRTVARAGPAAGAQLRRRRHRHAGRRRPLHGAGRGGGVRGQRDLPFPGSARAGPRPSSTPPPTGTTHSKLAAVSADLGEPMRGTEIAALPDDQRYAARGS